VPPDYIPVPPNRRAQEAPRVAKYAFLSDEWFTEVDKLVAANPDTGAPAHANVLVNLTITDTPFGDERQLHMGSKEGQGAFSKGHADGADVTLTTDYGTAKDVFVSGNPQAGMQAFMAGKVKVQGDMTKLMAAQAGGGGGNQALQQAITDMTE
jgi:putative sterol carrier protein